jgi:hypothetical protein
MSIKKALVIVAVLFGLSSFSSFLSLPAVYAQGSTSIRDVTNRYYAKIDSSGALLTTGTASSDVTVGNSTCYLTSAASTNAKNCKASAGVVSTIQVTNTTDTVYYLRLYNSAAAPTCSSATGYVETIPALAKNVSSRASSLQSFSAGIGFCLTGGGSSTDNTNAATGVYVTILYK